MKLQSSPTKRADTRAELGQGKVSASRDAIQPRFQAMPSPLGTMTQDSARSLQMRAFSERIHNSPRAISQRALIDAITNAPRARSGEIASGRPVRAMKTAGAAEAGGKPRTVSGGAPIQAVWLDWGPVLTPGPYGYFLQPRLQYVPNHVFNNQRHPPGSWVPNGFYRGEQLFLSYGYAQHVAAQQAAMAAAYGAAHAPPMGAAVAAGPAEHEDEAPAGADGVQAERAAALPLGAAAALQEPAPAQPGQVAVLGDGAPQPAIEARPAIEAAAPEPVLDGGAVAPVAARDGAAPVPEAAAAAAAPAPFTYVADGIMYPDWATNSVNAVNSPHATDVKGANAYVATVPTPGRGKDKAPTALAKQYLEEGFTGAADAKSRFALMVAVNRLDTVTRQEAANRDDVTALAGQAGAYANFRMGAIGYTWRVKWKKPDGSAANITDVRASALASPLNTQEAERREAGTVKTGLINYARNKVTGFDGTTAAIAHLKARYNNVYVHVGDPDAINLKAEPEPGADATPLFSRYDQVIADVGARGMISGGYYFRGNDEEAADPNKGMAATAGPQAVATNRLDMKVRTAIAARHAGVPYLPEPNLLVRSDLLNDGNRDRLFGVKGPEYRRLQKNLAQDPGQIAFDVRAAIYTDAGRFDKDVTEHGKHGAAHTRGMTSPAALFDPSRAKQSHAKYRELLNSISRAYGNADLIGPVLKAMLPQEALALADDQDGRVMAAAAARLAGFPAVLERIETYIKLIVPKGGRFKPGKTKKALASRGVPAAILTADFVNNVNKAVTAAKVNGKNLDQILAIAKAAGTAVTAFLREFKPAAAAPEAAVPEPAAPEPAAPAAPPGLAHGGAAIVEDAH